MKNIILISTLFAAGTLAASAETVLNQTGQGMWLVHPMDGSRVYDGVNMPKLFYGTSSKRLYPDADYFWRTGALYAYETSEFDFSNLEEAFFSLYVSHIVKTSCVTFTIFVEECSNIDLSSASVANECFDLTRRSINYRYKRIDISPSTNLEIETEYKIDITSSLKKITPGKDAVVMVFCTWTDSEESKVWINGDGMKRPISFSMKEVPEPSLFGLLAGTLALALAGTRRRRKPKQNINR